MHLAQGVCLRFVEDRVYQRHRCKAPSWTVDAKETGDIAVGFNRIGGTQHNREEMA